MATLRKNTNKSALDQIAKLQAAAVEERRKLRELERAREDAGRAVVARREELVAARHRGEGGAEQRKALDKAKAESRNHWDVEIEAQGLRLRDAERDVQRYVGENLEQVGQEKLSRDTAARDRVVELVDELTRAIANLEGEAQVSNELVQLAGLVPRTEGAPVYLGTEQLKDSLRRGITVKLPSARAWSPEREDVTVKWDGETFPEGVAGFVT
jgi:hypothetical protein